MMEDRIRTAAKILMKYIEGENFQGYDPYDTLNSPLFSQRIGKWAPILAIQFQKRNPVNLRPLLKIQKEHNPKAMGLLLRAYSILYQTEPRNHYRQKMDFLYKWLVNNSSQGYSGYCWGYNFPWASPQKYVDAFVPSAVVTGVVAKGIYEYYKTTLESRAIEILKGCGKFILNDLHTTKNDIGLCFSYTPLQRDCCYNAHLLAVETLACLYDINKDKSLELVIKKALNFIKYYQHPDGHWNYSLNDNGEERKQIDFHQGFILESLYSIFHLSDFKDDDLIISIRKGVEFYKSEQFNENGRAKWRLPAQWPVDIHHLSQGIITFSLLKNYNNKYFDFSLSIMKWTLDNMFSKTGYFYYRKGRFAINKISYIRWSQAWMLLALSIVLKNFQQRNENTI